MASPPPPTSTMPYSLADELTKVCDGTTLHGATDLITALLDYAGHDVSTFKRNTQVSYRLVSRARDLRDGINKLADTVDNTTSSDFSTFEKTIWSNYETYTAAVDPLEQLLFDLINLSSVEASLHLPDDSSISGCLTSVTRWEEHRRGLRKIHASLGTVVGLKDFPGISSISEEETANAEKLDDVIFISGLSASFSHDFSQAEGRVHRQLKKQIKNVETQLKALPPKLKIATLRDELLEIAGKSCMVLHGVLNLMFKSPEGDSTKNHLLKPEIWVEAEVLIKEILGVADSTSSDLKSVQDKYQAFVDLLGKVAGVVLPSRFYDLPKQVGKVRRAYFSRSHAFICACRVLALAFNNNAQKVRDNVHSLEEAIDDTILALQAAANAMTTIETFDVASIDTNDAGKAFAEAEAKIHECFTQCGLEQAWTVEKTKIDDAAKTDADRITQMNNRIKVAPFKGVNGSNTSTPVKVTVVTCIHSAMTRNDNKLTQCSHASGKIRHSSSYTMDPAALLSALLWKQANDFADDRKHLNEGRAHFEQSKDVHLSLDTAISSLKAAAGGDYELNLILE